MSNIKIVGKNNGTYNEIEMTSNYEIKVNDNTANTSLTTIAGDTTNINTKLPITLGQTTKSGSLCVTMASDNTVLTLSTPNKDNSATTLWSSYLITNGTNATTSSIDMALYSRLQVYGTTDNMIDIVISVQISDDNLNWYNYHDKDFLVNSQTGHFCTTLTDICVNYIRFYKANTSGSDESIILKTTIMK
jgi:hypothetical protein